MLDTRIKFRPLLAVLAVLGAPCAVLANDDLDDLDVTMQVLDSEAELDVLVSQMRGPGQSEQSAAGEDGTGGANGGAAPAEVEAGPFREQGDTDGFDRDRRAGEEELLLEDDWESDEGEDLELDELPKDDYVDPHY